MGAWSTFVTPDASWALAELRPEAIGCRDWLIATDQPAWKRFPCFQRWVASDSRHPCDLHEPHCGSSLSANYWSGRARFPRVQSHDPLPGTHNGPSLRCFFWIHCLRQFYWRTNGRHGALPPRLFVVAQNRSFPMESGKVAKRKLDMDELPQLALSRLSHHTPLCVECMTAHFSR